MNALASVAMAALLTAGWSMTAQASPATPSIGDLTASEPTPITILLMGDSYTAGNGARNADGNRSYYGPNRCMRSADTWGEKYADYLAAHGYAVTLLNRACSAATTGNMLHDRYMKDTFTVTYPGGEEVDAPRTDAFYADWASATPACTPAPATEEYYVETVSRGGAVDGVRSVTVACERWLRPQVDALNPDVDLVLFSVGGNDAHFPDIVRGCLVLSQLGPCRAAAENALAYAHEDFAGDLTDVFDEIHARTNGHAKVVYLGYPRLEGSHDLVLTAFEGGRLETYSVGAKLDEMAAAGAAAQRQAVDAANARYGEGSVMFLDGIEGLFTGHEPDGRASRANADRWIAEAFETTMKDEWYHFRPEGHAAIAQYVSGFGDFGATSSGSARDLAVVTDASASSRAAIAASATHDDSWTSVTVIEQRLAADGVSLERRIDLADASAAQVRSWALGGSRSNSAADAEAGWVPAAQLSLPARWNAAQQVLFVGDATLGTGGLDTLWSGAADGRDVAALVSVVDTAASPTVATDAYQWAASGPDLAVGRALSALRREPHAWAGGPYTAATTGDVTLDASGSFGSGPLTFAWDLDRDGVFETRVNGPVAAIAGAAINEGWLAVRVEGADGTAAISRAWVGPPTDRIAEVPPPCAGEAGANGDHSVRTAGRAYVAGGATGAAARSDGDGCRPLFPEGAVTEGSGGAVDGDGVMERSLEDRNADDLALIARWLEESPLMVEERTPRGVASAGVRGRSGTRPSSPSRRRPRQLVARERSLNVLLKTAGAADITR